jgi:hypothetical protein
MMLRADLASEVAYSKMCESKNVELQAAAEAEAAEAAVAEVW